MAWRTVRSSTPRITRILKHFSPRCSRPGMPYGTWSAPRKLLVGAVFPLHSHGRVGYHIAHKPTVVGLLYTHPAPTGLKEFQPSPLRFDMPMPARKMFLKCMAIEVGIFATAMATTAACWVWVLLLLPPLARVAVPAMLLAWCALSVWHVTRPLALPAVKETCCKKSQ